MRVLLTLAWRNLWRNQRRTSIMLGAIVVGVWAMIFMNALSQGMVTQMIEDGLSVIPGHVQARHPNYGDDPTVNSLLPDNDSAVSARLAELDAPAWTTRLTVPGVISSERESRGVTLIGVDPARDASLSFLADITIEGRLLDAVDDRGILIGRKLAETLDTELGKRVVIMSQTPDNTIADRGFRVVGVFDAKVELWEETWAITGKQTLQGLLGVPDRVTEAILSGADYRDVSDLAEQMQTAVSTDARVQTWLELDNYLATMLGVMDGFVLIWVVVIFLALSFGLVNTLVMAVFERVREIGLMLSLGMRPSSILGQIMLESMMLLLIGLVIGNLVAWLTIRPLESGIDLSMVAEGMEMMGVASVIYPDLRQEDVILANVVVLVLGFLASLSPAWRASRYDPVEALRKVD
ncbi:MAG: FtsX-like permease family protein [Pseudomonadota bacterium]